MAQESPDIRVSLDLLDIAISTAAEQFKSDELVGLLDAIGRGQYLELRARGEQQSLAEYSKEQLREAVEHVLYDDRVHDSHHPYFVESLVRRLVAKAGSVPEFARQFSELYGKLQEEHLQVLPDGKLAAAGWSFPESKIRFKPNWIEKLQDEDVITGLELLEDLEQAFKAGRPTVEIPAQGQKRRFRKKWDDPLADRRGIYEQSRERIAKVLMERREFKSLERLPEHYPDPERYRVEADPRRIPVLVEIFLQEYERRPGVRMAVTRDVPGWPGVPGRKRPQQRKAEALAAVGSAASSPKPPADFSWVDSCDPGIAREARDILGEVKAQLDLAKDVIRISPYPRGTDDLLWRGYHERQARIRMDVAEMLMKRGILSKAEHEFSGRLATRPNALLIEAHSADVECGLELLGARLEGRRPRPARPSAATSLPSVPEVAAPTHASGALEPPQAPSAPPPRRAEEKTFGVRGFGEEYGKGVAGELGKRTGAAVWWILAALVFLALGAIPQTRNAGVEYARRLIRAVMHPDSSRAK